MARRYDRRIWWVGLTLFVAVFLFAFLVQRSHKVNEDVKAASLANFDPGYIISDYQMGNYNSMNEAEIQSFLTAKNPCDNKDYNYYLRLSAANVNTKWHFENGHFVCLSEEKFGDGEVIGTGETAAHIIWQAAQDYKINPQVLIVLLQKESGLITDKIPNNVNYRSATGYGCPDTAACSEKYYGFKNQVRNAAAMFRVVLDGGWTNYPLGENYIQYNPSASCGGSVVNVKNLATSALYRYTPYQPNAGALAAGYGTAYCGAYGNRNFYLYFEDWFGGIGETKNIAAPDNVQIIQNGSNLTIKWSESSNIELYSGAKYKIVLADANKNEMKAEVGAGTLEYTFEKVPKGKYIAASVQAIVWGSKAHTRITFDVMVSSCAPDAPTNISVKQEDGGIKISWEKPLNVSSDEINEYEVVIADTDKVEYKKTVGGDEESVVFYGLPLREFFAASVKAKNDKGGNHARVTFVMKNYDDSLNDLTLYNGFLDMPQDETSKQAVSWAVNNGITDKNVKFNGDSSLTRRQAMVLFWRLVGQQMTASYNGFLDMPQDETSKQAVSWAVNNGIIDKNEYFYGEASLTRRQAMVILWRFYNIING